MADGAVSQSPPIYAARLPEITDGRVLELKSDRIPAWFKRAVLYKINPTT